MTTRRRKPRKSCKNGKLKRSVKTKKGGKRRCKKSKKRKRKRRSIKKSFRMHEGMDYLDEDFVTAFEGPATERNDSITISGLIDCMAIFIIDVGNFGNIVQIPVAGHFVTQEYYNNTGLTEQGKEFFRRLFNKANQIPTTSDSTRTMVINYKIEGTKNDRLVWSCVQYLLNNKNEYNFPENYSLEIENIGTQGTKTEYVN